MKKLFLFLYLGMFFIVASCDKSAKTEDLQESLDQEMIFTEGDNNAIPITPDATTMDVQLPNGNIITIDIPIEFQINEDGTPKVEKSATSRRTACTNVVTVYPYSNDSFTKWNVQNVNIKMANTFKFGQLNQQISSSGTPLDPGDEFNISVNSNNDNYGCNDITLIVGSWNCFGGKFDFMKMDFVGDISNVGMGNLSICHDKCGLNPAWSTFQGSGC